MIHMRLIHIEKLLDRLLISSPQRRRPSKKHKIKKRKITRS